MMRAMNLNGVRLAPAAGTTARNGGRPQPRLEGAWI